MSDWRGWGSEIKERFNKELAPESLGSDFVDYQEYFGEDFTIDHLLKIQEVKAKALIAGAIADFPEYLFDQLGVMQNTPGMPTIAKGLENLTDFLEQRFAE
ncbi:hypothetical protein JQM64_00155 [Fournierella massiliensis]|nr:hypothetical protein [Fournierella massiliensis]MCF2555962.1 hypothetical protein [Fournierella massiliensis]